MTKWEKEIDKLIEWLFGTVKTTPMGLFTQMGDKYPFVSEIKAEDWEFFWQLAGLYIAYLGARTYLSEKQMKYLQSKYYGAWDDEYGENEGNERAYNHLHQFITERFSRLGEYEGAV